MKKILRSVINVDGSLTSKDLSKNLYNLADAGLEFMSQEDQDIWEYVQKYALTYTNAPSVNSVRDFFETERKLEVLDRLDEISAQKQVYRKTDFENLVRSARREQNERKTSYLIKDAGHILTNELEIEQGRKKEVYRGYRDAIRYIMERADKLLTTDTGQVFRSDITTDGEEVRKDFLNTLSNLQNAWGRTTGLDNIDNMCRGAKPGELWIHAASTGELKTTFALNWAYKTAFGFGRNVYYYSLEMPVEQVRRIIYVMHSNHYKFKAMGYEPLDYRVIRDGVGQDNEKISKEDIELYNLVIEDIDRGRASGEYGRLYVECPQDPNTTVAIVKNRIELIHQSCPIHLVFLDYLTLLAPSRSLNNRREEMNSIFRECKQMCLTFNRGERIPIVALHQINREGKKEADKNDGHYSTYSLADTSAAERTADVITYTYLNDDLRASGQTKIGCIKNRDNPEFEPFLANIHFPSRFIKNIVAKTGDIGFEDIDLDLK